MLLPWHCCDQGFLFLRLRLGRGRFLQGLVDGLGVKADLGIGVLVAAKEIDAQYQQDADNEQHESKEIGIHRDS
jgi:hypothetical protein